MHCADKLVETLEELQRIAQQLRSRRKRIVFTNGCFDLIHRGHIEFLCQARGLGDVLIVAVNGDDSVRRLKGPGRPLMKQEDRAMLLAALECVDYVYIFDEPRCGGVIRAVCPDVYVKAKDYTPDTLDPQEKASLQECGAQMVFLEPVADYSTTNIIRRIKSLPDQLEV